MISQLYIKDFAIINELNITFHSGLNIITGETGAGKSIVIEAISLALGSRADTTYIRSGCNKAIIQLVASGLNPKVITLLADNGIPSDEDSLIIKRELSSTGKSLCRVNDHIVSVSFLSNLCKHVVDIHGQYDHQSLLDPENHLLLLDSYNNDKIGPAKSKVSEIYQTYISTRDKLNTLIKNSSDNMRKRDFMAFELKEIADAKLILGEDRSLDEQISLLQNSEDIYQNLSSAYDIIYGDDPSSLNMLKKALDLVSEVSSFSEELTETKSIFSDIYYKLEDIATEIRSIKDGISFSQEDLDNLIQRLDFIDKLKLKYGNSVEEILAYGENLSEKLSAVENIDSIKETLTDELGKSKSELLDACKSLSDLRVSTASILNDKIQNELLELYFKDSSFNIHFKEESGPLSPIGTDIVEFMISTNKGEPLKPLSKIASGGEMSRIMLAFKKITGDYDEIPTMIFDEIDSGISGIAASIVGKKLVEISKSHQILCITHLPQIAAFGRHNYMISKCSNEEVTYTTVQPLTMEEKILEIARLLGGLNITDSTLKSAQELIELSQ